VSTPRGGGHRRGRSNARELVRANVRGLARVCLVTADADRRGRADVLTRRLQGSWQPSPDPYSARRPCRSGPSGHDPATMSVANDNRLLVRSRWHTGAAVLLNVPLGVPGQASERPYVVCCAGAAGFGEVAHRLAPEPVQVGAAFVRVREVRVADRAFFPGTKWRNRLTFSRWTTSAVA
jgi:hypothetical protein